MPDQPTTYELAVDAERETMRYQLDAALATLATLQEQLEELRLDLDDGLPPGP